MSKELDYKSHKGLLALVGGAVLMVSGQASAYVCTGEGNDFDDPNCQVAEINDPNWALFAKDDLEPEDLDESNYGTLNVTQPASGNGGDMVKFKYEGLMPLYIVEKSDNWYSVYDRDQFFYDDFYDEWYFIREYPGDDFCSAQSINCSAATSHVGAYGVVPVPAAVWLFGSGLLGLVGVARRRKNV